MTTFYVGPRPVLQGRNLNNFVHSIKGTVGTYSHWSLMYDGNTILTGAPDNEYVLGTDSQAGILEYIWAGRHHIAPMVNPGEGERLEGARFRPLEYKGLAPIFSSGFGHADRETDYSVYNNYTFDGVPSAEIMSSFGHAQRYDQTYGGAFRPYINQGVSATALEDPGQALPVGNDNDYGHNRVNEWNGVPSARAL